MQLLCSSVNEAPCGQAGSGARIGGQSGLGTAYQSGKAEPGKLRKITANSAYHNPQHQLCRHSADKTLLQCYVPLGLLATLTPGSET